MTHLALIAQRGPSGPAIDPARFASLFAEETPAAERRASRFARVRHAVGRLMGF